MVIRWLFLTLFLAVSLAVSHAHAQSQSCLKLFSDLTESALASQVQLRSPGRQGTGIIRRNVNPNDPYVKSSVITNYSSVAEVIDALSPLKVTPDVSRARTTPVLRGSKGTYQISVQHNLLLRGDPAFWPLIDAQGNGMTIYSVRNDKKPPFLVYFHVGKSKSGLITHSFMIFDSIDAAWRYMATHDFDMTELQQP